MNKLRIVGKRVALLTTLPGLLAVCAAAQQSVITGRVQDSEGAAIARARILVHWDSSGGTVALTNNVGIPEDITTLSDKYGHFSVNVQPGFNDVFVSANAFTPVAAKVRVKTNAQTEFNVKLHADPQVTKELGD